MIIQLTYKAPNLQKMPYLIKFLNSPLIFKLPLCPTAENGKMASRMILWGFVIALCKHCCFFFKQNVKFREKRSYLQSIRIVTFWFLVTREYRLCNENIQAYIGCTREMASDTCTEKMRRRASARENY